MTDHPDENEFPVLNDVIRRGDQDVIKTARLEREIFEELELFNPARAAREPAVVPTPGMTPVQEKVGPLAEAIDNIVEHHARRMRQEIAELLRQRLGDSL